MPSTTTSKRHIQKKIKPFTKRFLKSIWAFPVILFLVVGVLTSLKISGTSIGMYHQILYGEQVKDPNLIAGNPQPIRSDEWLFMTQMTIAQSQAGYPRINQNIAEGKDMSVILDVPYKEWSTIFKPQNLSFFALPLEHAFAFKWWFILFLLITSVYFFILKVTRFSRPTSIVLSIALSLSPFVFWWYQSATVLPFAYAFLMALLIAKIIDGDDFFGVKQKIWKSLLYGIVFAYILVAFALLIYPPFQIPIVLITLAFAVGYMLNKVLNEQKPLKLILQRFSILTLAAITALSIVIIFALTRLEAIHIIMNTVYPGQRSVPSGGGSYLLLFDGFLNPQLQSLRHAAHFVQNQSEASNFILVLPFLILPAFALSFECLFKKKRVDWVLVLFSVCAVVFMLNSFVPFGDRAYKLILLDKVPHDRLMLGVGVLASFIFIYILKGLDNIKTNLWSYRLLVTTYVGACFIALLWAGYYAADHYPKFISSDLKIFAFAGGSCAILFFAFLRYRFIAALILLCFSLGSVFYIHPLYKGLGFDTRQAISQEIAENSKPGDTWVTADSIVFENAGIINNRDSIGGIQFYPNLSFWKQIAGANDEDIYNRYAHVVFRDESAQERPLQLLQVDSFSVQLNCGDFITKNVDFILSSSKLNKPCFELKDTIAYPLASFYVYEVK